MGGGIIGKGKGWLEHERSRVGVTCGMQDVKRRRSQKKRGQLRLASAQAAVDWRC